MCNTINIAARIEARNGVDGVLTGGGNYSENHMPRIPFPSLLFQNVCAINESSEKNYLGELRNYDSVTSAANCFDEYQRGNHFRHPSNSDTQSISNQFGTVSRKCTAMSTTLDKEVHQDLRKHRDVAAIKTEQIFDNSEYGNYSRTIKMEPVEVTDNIAANRRELITTADGVVATIKRERIDATEVHRTFGIGVSTSNNYINKNIARLESTNYNRLFLDSNFQPTSISLGLAQSTASSRNIPFPAGNSIATTAADTTNFSDLMALQCSTCFKHFSTMQQLTQHKLVHSNVRNYKCHYCLKAFKQLSHVQQHQRIHTGELPFRCSKCNKKFRQSSSLQQHLRGHCLLSSPSSQPRDSTLQKYKHKKRLKQKPDSSLLQNNVMERSDQVSHLSSPSSSVVLDSSHVQAPPFTFPLLNPSQSYISHHSANDYVSGSNKLPSVSHSDRYEPGPYNSCSSEIKRVCASVDNHSPAQSSVILSSDKYSHTRSRSSLVQTEEITSSSKFGGSQMNSAGSSSTAVNSHIAWPLWPDKCNQYNPHTPLRLVYNHIQNEHPALSPNNFCRSQDNLLSPYRLESLTGCSVAGQKRAVISATSSGSVVRDSSGSVTANDIECDNVREAISPLPVYRQSLLTLCYKLKEISRRENFLRSTFEHHFGASK